MPRRRTSKSLIPPWLEIAPQPAILLAGNGAVESMNPAAAAWLGLEPESWVDRVPQSGNVQSADKIDRHLAGLASAVAQGEKDFFRTTVFAIGEQATPDYRTARGIKIAQSDSVRPMTLLIVCEAGGQNVPGDNDPGSRAERARMVNSRWLQDQTGREIILSLLGSSDVADSVRAQVAAAELGASHLLIAGPRGGEQQLLANHIHRRRYQSSKSPPPLTVLQSAMVDQAFVQDVIRLALSERKDFDPPRVCLLLADCERLDTGAQTELSGFLRISAEHVVLMATSSADDFATKLMKDGFDTFLASRLRGQTIVLPPVCERRGDIAAMITALIDKQCALAGRPVLRIGSAAMEMLYEYGWPEDAEGMRAVATELLRNEATTVVETRDLPTRLRMAVDAQRSGRLPAEKIVLNEFLADIERELISRALTASKFNRSAAARMVGMNRARFLRRCQALGITLPGEVPDFEPIDFEEATE